MFDLLESVMGSGDFAGVVIVERGGNRIAQEVRGAADRANERAIGIDTRFGVASVTKGLTAVTVGKFIEAGELSFDTRVRDVLGGRLPSIDDGVTVEHLLGHTSGIGDYLDEEELGDIDDHILDRSAHHFDRALDYLSSVDGFPQRTEPGKQFAYNNGGYVVLSILLELVSGRAFHELVSEHVLAPAAMDRSGFHRSDDLPGDTALGYLESGRTNVFHLPARGAGDGGLYATAPDLLRFWSALLDGALLGRPMVRQLLTPRTTAATGDRYGLGFWMRPDAEAVFLEGMDAGVSCRTGHHRASAATYAVVSNTSSGAWAPAAQVEVALSRRDDVGGDPPGSP